LNRKELQSLARVRLAEARALLDAGFPDGAYYLAGYAAECALKACIAKQTRRFDFPSKKTVDSSHTHNLKSLIEVAKLEAARAARAAIDPVFGEHWEIVQGWSEQSRYETHDIHDAGELLLALTDRKYGVWHG